MSNVLSQGLTPFPAIQNDIESRNSRMLKALASHIELR